jgi:hypothetical protein
MNFPIGTHWENIARFAMPFEFRSHAHILDLRLVSLRFVLTYIPDLMWCHLAPMLKDGVFGADRKRSQGRPKWRLVDEKLGKELDISSSYCIPLRSKALRKTADADKEEWDILDDSIKNGTVDANVVDPLSDTGEETHRIIRKQPMRARSAIKPMGGKLAVVKPPNVVPGSPRSLTPKKKRTRSSSPPRWTPKQNEHIDDLAPARKARRISSAGARRCALQS